MFLPKLVPLDPVKPCVFSDWPGREGGGGLTGLDAKNQGYHKLIKMKLCMNHDSHKSMPDAKFESGSFPSFGDMTSQNFSLKKGTSHRIRIYAPGKWV